MDHTRNKKIEDTGMLVLEAPNVVVEQKYFYLGYVVGHFDCYSCRQSDNGVSNSKEPRKSSPWVQLSRPTLASRSELTRYLPLILKFPGLGLIVRQRYLSETVRLDGAGDLAVDGATTSGRSPSPLRSMNWIGSAR